MRALLVTGQPSCGKTTLVKKLVREVQALDPDLPVTGFVTEEVQPGDCSTSNTYPVLSGLCRNTTVVIAWHSKSF